MWKGLLGPELSTNGSFYWVFFNQMSTFSSFLGPNNIDWVFRGIFLVVLASWMMVDDGWWWKMVVNDGWWWMMKFKSSREHAVELVYPILSLGNTLLDHKKVSMCFYGRVLLSDFGTKREQVLAFLLFPVSHDRFLSEKSKNERPHWMNALSRIYMKDMFQIVHSIYFFVYLINWQMH